jgi:hypothetical protein
MLPAVLFSTKAIVFRTDEEVNVPVLQDVTIGPSADAVALAERESDRHVTDWPHYLAGRIDDLMRGSAQVGMYAVGGFEILVDTLVALRSRYGAPSRCSPRLVLVYDPPRS